MIYRNEVKHEINAGDKAAIIAICARWRPPIRMWARTAAI